MFEIVILLTWLRLLEYSNKEAAFLIYKIQRDYSKLKTIDNYIDIIFCYINYISFNLRSEVIQS
jgi:hypothetical protein